MVTAHSRAAPLATLDTLQLLMGGFASVMQPANLLFALVGCMLGTLVGVLPGIGPAAGTAILIPLTAALNPTGAIIMLAAIYYGAMYGGTITSVLINTPGEAASAVTCIDGYAMAKRGRAGPALAIAAIGSFVGGTVATVGLVLLALPLTRLALSFGPPEYFALLLVGLSLVTGPCQPLAGARADRRRARPAAGANRHRPGHGRAALHLRPNGIARRLRHRARGDGIVRHRRDPARTRNRARARSSTRR